MSTYEQLPLSGPEPRASRAPRTTAALAWARGAWDVVVLEAQQRLRSRGWYIMLAVWFVLIGIVTWLTWAAFTAQQAANRSSPGVPALSEPGGLIFEVVLLFVLFLASIVAPALSANAVNGDRSHGTLAVLQASLLRPGQILAGKMVAAWIAAFVFLVAASPFLVVGVAVGRLSPAYVIVAVGALTLELGVICAVGTAVSALAARPVFSIVVTYLVVAMLCVGTVVAFAFGASILGRGTVQANDYRVTSLPTNHAVPVYGCTGTLRDVPAVHTERVAWLLAMNPYVVVADVIPYPDRSQSASPAPQGAVEVISQGARIALAGPEAVTQCANGVPRQSYLVQTTPLWPLGLGLQLALAGVLMWGARRALVTPAKRLARGTRVA